MEDLERYGDYNDTEEAEVDGGAKIPVLKILIAIVIVSVLGLLGYRLYLFDTYPKEMKSLLPTDALVAYVGAAEETEILTQELRFPYDDNREGNFFCGQLAVIPAIGELQVTVRLNVSTLEKLSEKYGVSLSADDCRNTFVFRLTDNFGRDYGEPAEVLFGERAMYRYYRLAFDGIAFDAPTDGFGAPEWIRLEITVCGQSEPAGYVSVYENNEQYHAFSALPASRKEVAK